MKITIELDDQTVVPRLQAIQKEGTVEEWIAARVLQFLTAEMVREARRREQESLKALQMPVVTIEPAAKRESPLP